MWRAIGIGLGGFMVGVLACYSLVKSDGVFQSSCCRPLNEALVAEGANGRIERITRELADIKRQLALYERFLQLQGLRWDGDKLVELEGGVGIGEEDFPLLDPESRMLMRKAGK